MVIELVTARMRFDAFAAWAEYSPENMSVTILKASIYPNYHVYNS